VARYEFSSDGLGRTKEKELQMQSIIAELPVTSATMMPITEMTPQALAATLLLSVVAATAAAAAATMRATKELHQERQQMPLVSPPNVSQQLFPAIAAPVPAPENIEQPVAQPNGVEWFKENGCARLGINNQQRVLREWSIKTITGDTVSPTWNKELAGSFSRLDMFLNMIGLNCLDNIVMFTNMQLNKKGKMATTRQEVLKFFGVCILATKFEFGSRAELWSTTEMTKYYKPPGFGSTGMSRQRFDILYTSV
jgi:hypothetical protein